MQSLTLPLLAAFLTATAVILVHWTLLRLAAHRRRLNELKAKVEAGHGVSPESQAFKVSEVKGALANMFTALGERFKPKDALKISKTRFDLIRAGFRQPRSLVAFYGIKGVLLLAAGARRHCPAVVFHRHRADRIWRSFS